MHDLSCHCGQIHIGIEKRPDFIHACNCTLCAKTGALWAYFHPSEVRVDGTAARYCRTDKDAASAQIQFCPTCGATTHFTLTADAIARFGDSMMGVNMRLAEARDLAGLEMRYPDGRGWSGEGDFTYVRAARVIGQDGILD